VVQGRYSIALPALATGAGRALSVSKVREEKLIYLEQTNKAVLPDRIELSTSPFITLRLSRPPRAAFCALDIPSPWVPRNR